MQSAKLNFSGPSGFTEAENAIVDFYLVKGSND